MKRKKTRTILIFFVVFLSLVLFAVVGLADALSRREPEAPVMQTDPPALPSSEKTAPPTAESTVPPATEPPQPKHYLLSFAGDCTLGTGYGRVKDNNFLGVVGDDFDYPFARVLRYFQKDDCTFINLETPFTDGGEPQEKEFVFKGPPAYKEILVRGDVEFANVANNHSYDYGEEGYRDTLAALDSVGIPYAEPRKTTLFTTETGLTIGVYADSKPQSDDGVAQGIQSLRDRGAQLIVAIFHWGQENHYLPNGLQKTIAHTAVDAGAHIVYGTHPHVLQPIEEYNGGIIYYSLGNFSFGGNVNPPDKDTVILQQEVIVEPGGAVRLGELTKIPCYVTGTKTKGNDYQPTPMEEGSEAYERVLQKLSGTFPKKTVKS